MEKQIINSLDAFIVKRGCAAEFLLFFFRTYPKNRILVQNQGGPDYQTGGAGEAKALRGKYNGISRIALKVAPCALKTGTPCRYERPNAEFGLKGFFEMGSNNLAIQVVSEKQNL